MKKHRNIPEEALFVHSKVTDNDRAIPVLPKDLVCLSHYLLQCVYEIVIIIIISDIRGFSWLTQGKSGEELQKKEEHLGWKWWAGHRLSLVD